MSNDHSPRQAGIAILIIVLVAALVVMAALYQLERAKHRTVSSKVEPRGGPFPLPKEEVLLHYRGGEIRVRDLKEDVGPEIEKFAQEQYKLAAGKALLEKLLEAEAKKQGQPDINILLDKVAPARPVGEREIDDFISENDLKDGFKDPTTGERSPVSREQIREHIASLKQKIAKQDFVDSKLKAAGLVWAPMGRRSHVPPLSPDEPVKGNRDAKVVIYEYSDFECPWCAEERLVLAGIEKAYGNKVAIVFRHFPLDLHPNARSAGMAAICAQEQGKFWQYHDKLFADQDHLSDANYLKWANEIGLDEAKFKECRTSGRARKTLDNSISLAGKAGIDSVPTFFVETPDGETRLQGARSFATFKELIDAGLRQ